MINRVDQILLLVVTVEHDLGVHPVHLTVPLLSRNLIDIDSLILLIVPVHCPIESLLIRILRRQCLIGQRQKYLVVLALAFFVVVGSRGVPFGRDV